MSQLCALPKASDDLLDDTVINEARYILEDMDPTTFHWGVYGQASGMTIQVDPFLKAAFEWAPERPGQAWLGRIITATDGDRRQLTRVAKLFFEEVLVPMRLRASERSHKFAPKPSIDDEVASPTSDTSPFSSPKMGQILESKLLIRDGHKCCITSYSPQRNQPSNSTTSLIATVLPPNDQLEVTHIFPLSLGDDHDDHENLLYDPCVFWEVLQNYAPSLNGEWLRGEGMQSPANSLILTHTIRKAFTNLELCLAPSNTQHTYAVKNYVRDPWLHRQINGLPNVTLRDHCDTDAIADIGLPDPRILSLHAALTFIMQTGGAGRALDRAVKDVKGLSCLTSDGSTDVRTLLLVVTAVPKTSV
ncbi:hypothetical protein M407DRAFT_242638 [Tulasnella calospora MUT 4182]|uniref:Uncharacterized protein n=1 Tax=Tulasnella calospora MUT 4182 TaxID=1051891 RepID=A0A0C3QPT6_9AGAM|nr:hypothetical protein M407DRAFT_242638 [Tulasnella calospora MUT 4182]